MNTAHSGSWVKHFGKMRTVYNKQEHWHKQTQHTEAVVLSSLAKCNVANWNSDKMNTGHSDSCAKKLG